VSGSNTSLSDTEVKAAVKETMIKGGGPMKISLLQSEACWGVFIFRT